MLSEREKMLAGRTYDARDAELVALAHRARDLVAAYSATPSSDAGARSRILSAVMGSVGSGVWIEAPFFVDYGINVSIGDDTFINTGAVLVDDNVITIGARVLIAPNVQLLTAYHPVSAADRITASAERLSANAAPYRTLTAPVSVGDEVWLGAGAIVLPGVTIGDRTTVGAGSVVTADLPPDVLAVGNPARVVRTLTDR